MKFVTEWCKGIAMDRPSIVAGILMVAVPLTGHDIITTKITWSQEISRIVYSRCLGCHRDGGPAFPLASYAEARPWAKAIKEEVLARRMPPWNAVKGFGQFLNDRGLTQEELSLIAEWVEGGAPEGNPQYLPEVPGKVDPVKPTASREITFSGVTVLSETVHAAGIRVTEVPESGSLQAIAIRPDGSTEPLVWIQKRNPSVEGVYWFRSALSLPARTRLETIPASARAALLVR
jgi:hypothetical protein